VIGEVVEEGSGWSWGAKGDGWRQGGTSTGLDGGVMIGIKRLGYRLLQNHLDLDCSFILDCQSV
jgi:hypothetical protein